MLSGIDPPYLALHENERCGQGRVSESSTHQSVAPFLDLILWLHPRQDPEPSLIPARIRVGVRLKHGPVKFASGGIRKGEKKAHTGTLPFLHAYPCVPDGPPQHPGVTQPSQRVSRCQEHQSGNVW